MAGKANPRFQDALAFAVQAHTAVSTVGDGITLRLGWVNECWAGPAGGCRARRRPCDRARWPGLGKTRVIVERAVRLIDEERARPEQLLVLTFSRKAATDLRERIAARLQQLRELHGHDVPRLRARIAYP